MSHFIRVLRLPSWYWFVALVLLALGLGLRLYDLTDQPIDFHPTRQLRSAIIARGMYYNMLPTNGNAVIDPAIREQAINFWYSTGQYEPSILENLAARVYLLSGAKVEDFTSGIFPIVRVINSLSWAIAGLALFDLARRAVSPAASLVSLAYYMLLPFAVQASRSFQPDPGMTMWIVLCVYFLYRWSEGSVHSWKWAILAGLTGGMAILTKFPAIYMVAGASIAVSLSSQGIRRVWRSPQVWVMAILMITPALLFYLSRQGRVSEYVDSWTIALSHLLLNPETYVRWFNLIQNLMGLTVLLLGLIGVVIAENSVLDCHGVLYRPRYRNLLIGLWIGYIIYGLTLPYQMYTHTYYHLQLTPLVALSLAPVAGVILDRLTVFSTVSVQPKNSRFWQAVVVCIALVGILFVSLLSINTFNQEDFRDEPAHWETVASYLPTDGKIIALTQEYGYPLMYYGWRKVTLWPNRGEQALAKLRGREKEFETYFSKMTDGKSYFLITAFNQFNDQTDLKQYLSDHYPVLAEGSGYLIYDLTRPLIN